MKTETRFQQDIRGSESAVKAVARLLESMGYSCVVHPLRVRPSVRDRRAYRDDADLTVVGKGRVEVKGRRIDFSTKDDFPYDSVFCTSKHIWDGYAVKPLGCFVVNKSLTACLLAPSDQFDGWTTVRFFDPAANQHETTYACPLSLCKLYQIPPE